MNGEVPGRPDLSVSAAPQWTTRRVFVLVQPIHTVYVLLSHMHSFTRCHLYECIHVFVTWVMNTCVSWVTAVAGVR